MANPIFVKFGFPLDMKPGVKFQQDRTNHPSAINYPDHVDTYLKEEIKQGALVGPFKNPMANLHVSPFMTREKSDSVNRRVIVDLSWPKGGSINDWVSDNVYLGTEFFFINATKKTYCHHTLQVEYSPLQ